MIAILAIVFHYEHRSPRSFAKQYLGDIYHEWATMGHPKIVKQC
ncbi:DUF7661 family protein [Shewanella sp. HL-SH8]